MIKTLREKTYQFFFKPTEARPLAALRIGLSFTLLVQAALVSGLLFELYGKNGIIQGKIREYFAPPIPHITGFSHLLMGFGLSEDQVLLLFAMTYLVSLVGLLVGWHTRAMAIVAWFTHLVLAQGHSTSYGADMYANIFLFYLMFVPCGKAWSLDARTGRIDTAPSSTARLGLRLVQIHLAIGYVASGWDKAQGPQWWNGEAIWRSLMLPVYYQLPMEWMANVPWLCMLLGWGTLALEMGYPLWVFPRKLRPFGVAGIVSLHLGIAIFLGLHVFALMMAVFTLALFGFSAEPVPKTEEVRNEATVPLRAAAQT